jgi:hypothetical protein
MGPNWRRSAHLDARERLRTCAPGMARLGAEVRGAAALALSRRELRGAGAAASRPARRCWPTRRRCSSAAATRSTQTLCADRRAPGADPGLDRRARDASSRRRANSWRWRGEDLAAQAALLTQGLTQTARVTALRREAAEIEGRIGELEAGIAEARSQIAGFEIEALRIAAEWREAAQTGTARVAAARSGTARAAAGSAKPGSAG